MHPAPIRNCLALLLAASILGGCGDDAPDGSPMASPTPAVSFTQVGDGSVLESEWSYGVGMDGDAWCTRLQVAGTASSRCGDLLPADGQTFGELGHGPDEYTDAQVIEGFVGADAVTVWFIGDRGQYRIPAVLMPLDEVGLADVHAYVGFALADVTLTHLQAIARNGDILQTVQLP